VVLIFLRNNRSTLIAALAIPASVISSFTLYYAAGFTLNSMSLMGLSLSIGLVIDDAIVVLEAIYRRIEQGAPPLRAAELASSEVTLAVVSTTLAVCAVFVPIAFLEGMVGVWFYEFGLVVVFMAVFYQLSGLIAIVAMILNTVYVIAALAGFGATLTLPGIAGLVLTIGMAVDANVLIFERIREELRNQRSVRQSVQMGYDRAFRTILDANLTTLISAVFLFQFGTGPIKGFAVTLSVGLIANMFTAVLFTRMIFDFMLGRGKVERLSI